MALIIYDGKGQLFYYERQIRQEGGVIQKAAFFYPAQEVTVVCLGCTTARHLAQKFLDKYFIKATGGRKQFPILALQQYLKKHLSKLYDKIDDYRYRMVIYSNYKTKVVYSLDEIGYEEYGHTDRVIAGNRADFAHGAMEYCQDGHKVMQLFSQYFSICESEYKTLTLWGEYNDLYRVE